MVRDLDVASRERKELGAPKPKNEHGRTESVSSSNVGVEEELKESRRKAKIAEANSPKYLWTQFVNIRNSDDFASGILFSSTRNAIKAGQFSWQKDEINKSMTSLSKEVN
jgi:hypothetical protein